MMNFENRPYYIIIEFKIPPAGILLPGSVMAAPGILVPLVKVRVLAG